MVKIRYLFFRFRKILRKNLCIIFNTTFRKYPKIIIEMLGIQITLVTGKTRQIVIY
jgi:hypothetical protein